MLDSLTCHKSLLRAGCPVREDKIDRLSYRLRNDWARFVRKSKGDSRSCKILEFLVYQETQAVGIARRIKYAFNLARLASILGGKGFEKAARSYLEAAIREHG